MTLIIAGYEYSKSIDLTDIWDDLEREPYVPKMEVNGLFIVADSAITNQGMKTLLNEFQKVHKLEAKLWKPYFYPDGAFKSYREVHETLPFFVGFAGSTLIAHHIINNIIEHLGNLRISYTTNKNTSAIEYRVILHCESNPLSLNVGDTWDDDTFLDRHFEGLLKGEIIAEFVEHSINNAFHSASSYKKSKQEFDQIYTEIVVGVWCPYRKRHELYLYRMLSKENENIGLVAYTKKELVLENKIAVLGMKNKFEADAQEKFTRALSDCLEPAKIMYQFLNDSIDIVQNAGSKEISRPIFFRKLNCLDTT